MKNILSRLKKSLMPEQGTITNEDPGTPAPADHKSFMPATPALREAITGFIIQSLQPYVDEKAISVNGIHFYIISNNREEEEAARVALYLDRPGMFKSEQLERKLLDHFIQLDPGWFFEAHIIKEQQLPDKCIRKLNFGLNVIRSGEQASDHCSKALVQVLTGQAEQSEYSLEPDKQLKFYIGRTRMPQLLSGKIQQNDIVFLGKEEQGFNELTGNPNLHVSRNHACIIYEPGTNHWLLYPDKGGLPENSNKIKVHTADDKVKWLNIYGVPHCLCDGDQVELGGEAVFRFRIIQA